MEKTERKRGNQRRRGRRRERRDGAGKGATVAAATVVWGCRRRASSLPSLGLITIVVAIAVARRGEREGKIRDWPRERGESKDTLVGVLLAATVGARHHYEDEPRQAFLLSLLPLSIATRECAADLLLPRANAGAAVMITAAAMKLKGKGVVMLNYAIATSRLRNIMASRRLTRATASSSTTLAPALAPAAPAPSLASPSSSESSIGSSTIRCELFHNVL
ncbi:uncharacterized protein DS421_14g459050 [Arachis hypogaea]|nr:uncharacterized protein DS421_14g459050 [Arachis hypogaea]